MEVEDSLPETIEQDTLPETIAQDDDDVEMEDVETLESLPETIVQDSLPETQVQQEAGEIPRTRENLPRLIPLKLETMNDDLEAFERAFMFMLKDVDIQNVTRKMLRADMEKIYGFPHKSLKPYKELIREIVTKFMMENHPQEVESARQQEPPRKKRKKRQREERASPEAGARRRASVRAPPRTSKKKKARSLLDVDPDLENNWEVFVDERDGDRIYSVMLNQTDLTYNQRGKNKFYTVQLLTGIASRGDECILVCKWGRVGCAVPQSSRKRMATRLQGKAEFKRKFKSKTGNTWGTAIFHPVRGKYVIVDVVAGDGEEEISWEDAEATFETSKLSFPLFELVRLICSRKLAAAHLKALNVDVDRCPLGRLSEKQISTGFVILSKLSQKLQSGRRDAHEIFDLSNKFYTLIPHDFGMSRPPPISTMKHLRNKIQLLELLGELQNATRIFSLRGGTTNVVDLHYHALECRLTTIDEQSTLETVSQMLSGTQSPSHNEYVMRIQNVFAVDRPGEKFRSAPFEFLPNHRMLWHGSRITNFMGILSQGLRIAPREAPRTGYMFGKGIYFADCSSKSANYCHATRENPYGILLLADVALGNMHEKVEAEYLEKAPKYYHSVWGKGQLAPDPNNMTQLEGCDAFVGPLQDSGVDSSLKHNEYIVYDIAQVLTRFLVLVKFDFK